MTSSVALIDPLAEIDGRKVFFLRDTFGGEVPLSCPYPPLELAFAASLLREGGHRCELVAANVHGLSHAVVAQKLQDEAPSFVLIPSAWGSLDDDRRLLQNLRATLPDSVLCISGPNVTASAARVLSESEADVVIRGEPEEAIRLLADGVQWHDIPNLAFMNGSEVQLTERRLPPGWMTQPMPARDLLDLSLYTIPFARRGPATTVLTTRGCAHTCTFCPSQIWHHREVRSRPIDLVIAEFEELVGRYGIREIHFRDDTFTGDHERVHALCDAMDTAGLDLSWRCFGTVSTVNRELLQRMNASGCFQVCFGFESGDDAVLKKTGKGTTVSQGVDAARWTHDAGMEVSGTFMVGLEGATADSVNKSISFAIGNDLDYVQVNVAVPLPTTGFGKRHDRKGLESRPEEFRWIGADPSESATMPSEKMSHQVRRFYRRFYLRPGYVAGRLTSSRGLHALFSHARLGGRMVKAIAMSR
jgi:radical SAM superfamily enzyme YgiQ (UPF0313 family)